MKKVISLLLALLMMVSLLPISVFAEAKDTCVWVNGEQFTSEKLTISCGDGTATYDPGTATLTLNNATITKTIKASGKESGIYSESDITIIAKGDNKIDFSGNYSVDGIYADGSITLKGNGNLDIKAGNTGIEAEKDVNISGSGDIDIKSEKNGFNVTGNSTLTIGGSGKLTVDAGSYGILCCNMIFTGERTADITAGEDGIAPAGEVELGGSGDITITAEEYGINVYDNGDVNISGSGKLTVTAGYQGIVSYNGAILSGSGEVEIYGKKMQSILIMCKARYGSTVPAAPLR